MDPKEFEDLVAQRLKDAGIKFERAPALGGVRPDFLLQGPQGQLVVVEAKVWPSAGGNTARAVEQVERYRKVTGVENVFLVLPALQRNIESKGVVSLDRLVDSVVPLFEASAVRYKRRLRALRSKGPTVFAAMPFSREYDDTYFVAMSHAADETGATCTRVDQTEFSGDVVSEIRQLITESVAVIVDLSEARPNVLYEAGYAHALEKPAVHICSTPLSALPFDVRNWNTIEYSRGQTSRLREPLARRLKSVIG